MATINNFAIHARYARRFFCAVALLIFYAAHALYVHAEKITFSANNMTGTAGNTSDTTTLRGNAYVLTSSIEIAADAITMSGQNFRYIEADGNITGKNLEAKLEFTCGKLLYDRKTKIATLRDNVHLDDIENNVTADAQIIEYNQTADIAIIQIDITLKQKDNICKSAYAVYRKKTQMLELSGNSQITQGEDTFRAQEITLNLSTQEITLDGRVKGSVVDSGRAQDEDAQNDASAEKSVEQASDNSTTHEQTDDATEDTLPHDGEQAEVPREAEKLLDERGVQK